MDNNIFYVSELKEFTPQEILEILDKTGQIDYPDSEGNTLLLAACENYQCDYIRYCLEQGANPNYQNQRLRDTDNTWGHRPLLTLLEYASLHTWQPGGDDLSQLPEVLSAMLAAGADPEQTISICGSTPLILSLRYGYTDCVRILLAQEVNLDYIDYCGESALSIAIDSGNVTVVEMLLKAGADTENRSHDVALTPFMLACIRDSARIVELLVEYGCDVRATCRDGGTPFDAAYLLPVHHKSKEWVAFVREMMDSPSKRTTRKDSKRSR